MTTLRDVAELVRALSRHAHAAPEVARTSLALRTGALASALARGATREAEEVPH